MTLIVTAAAVTARKQRNNQLAESRTECAAFFVGKNMQKTELKLRYELVDIKENAMPVIIVAAGNSTRMNGVNKQFIKLQDIPLVARTLLCFENSAYVSRIILVTKEEDIPSMQILAEKYSVSKLTDIVKGGANRQESVCNGMAMLKEDENNVLIQDGARPFADERIIGDVAEALGEYSAATCGVKVKDTVKEITKDGISAKTLNRDSLFAVQTPQGVRVKAYKSALARFEDLSVFTDDTSIMEAAGYKVKCVEGSYRNIKITTPEDLIIAEFFLKEEY